MQLDGDVNPMTGDPAMRLLAYSSWRPVQQRVSVVPGQTYTLSGWVNGGALQVGFGVNFLDGAGKRLGQGYVQYNGGGDWEHLTATSVAPAGTAGAVVWVQDQSGPAGYALFSDLQLEAGAAATAYSETAGVYYPNSPRTDGTPAPPPNSPVYRFYEAADGDHLYDTVITPLAGYAPEGPIGYAPTVGSAGAVPLYRLFSAPTGEHLLTANGAERAALVQAGWQDQGAPFSVLSAAAPGTVPFYRLDQPGGKHFYTTRQAEHDALVKAGWKDEGAAGYLDTHG